MTDNRVRACVAHAAGDLRVDDLPMPRVAEGTVAVDIQFGGICGSDLHYYHRGGVGDFVLREPLVLGHEVVGVVRESSVGTLPPGTPVAVHPATPCGHCPECRAGRRNVCRDTRYLGSAARFPHVQGGFVTTLVVPSAQVFALPSGLSLQQAALAEPLSVALHAVSRAGDLRGRSVLITGAGPIGCLVVAAARAAGAGSITVCDLVPEALNVAAAVGASSTILVGEAGATGWPVDVDVAIEASGSASGLRACLEHVRRGGVLVQLGLLPPGETPVAGNLLVTREISLVGAFRFDGEFERALTLLAGGLDIDPVITQVFALENAVEAFDVAGDRRRACKVLLSLETP